MSSSELKSNLHELIDGINDDSILKAVYEILNNRNQESDISEAEKNAIEEGLRSIKEGRTISHETVMSELRKKYPFLK